MKFSVYNERFEVDGKTYLYNILSTALAEINLDVDNAIRKGSLDGLNNELTTLLKSKHFAVDDDSDEVKEYMYFYNSTRYGYNARLLSVVFIPTYNCNLSCPYCLQGLDKNHGTITQESMMAIVKFIENKIIESRQIGVVIDKLDINLFGGEPLLAKQSLENFCELVNDIAIKYQCLPQFTMTSNFTLFDDDVLSFIKKYNISVQISIDGTKEQHNIRRIRRDGTGTYDIIINNLKIMNEAGLKDNIVIRINLDENNIAEADRIMSSISGLADDIYFGYLDNYKGSNDGYTNCVEHKNYAKLLNTTLIPIYQKYGKVVHRAYGKMSPCSMHTENRFIVDFKLNVYKCEVLINKEETKVGVIDENGFFIPNANFYRQMEFNLESVSRCRNCKLLPMCAGGCTGKAYINGEKQNINFDNVLCHMREDDLITHLKGYVRRMQ